MIAITAAVVLAATAVGDVGGGRFAVMSGLQTVQGTVISICPVGMTYSR